ncbi:hypothetical protein E2C01_056807 [Portunus trituberculatus]|uniref:Uncharacterized protein n=1 Tax=Portunus trituberculatus TaxID=210409 RepID=A0A5B7GYR5_PORTR|nr:hypothetical protein [Portunus trituberculatus]
MRLMAPIGLTGGERKRKQHAERHPYLYNHNHNINIHRRQPQLSFSRTLHDRKRSGVEGVLRTGSTGDKSHSADCITGGDVLLVTPWKTGGRPRILDKHPSPLP